MNAGREATPALKPELLIITEGRHKYLTLISEYAFKEHDENKVVLCWTPLETVGFSFFPLQKGVFRQDEGSWINSDIRLG